MRIRTLMAVATALVVLGVSFDAVASSRSRAERPGPASATLHGPVVDWSATAASLTIDDPRVTGGPRAVRRALRALDEVAVLIGPRTRILAEDEDGVRERIDAAVLFAELDGSDETLEVAVVATVGRRTSPRPGAAARPGASPKLTAKRIVLFLPPLAEDGGEELDEGDPDASGGEGDPGDVPPGDEGDPADPPPA